MSGKAPPTGPRALLNSLNPGPSKRQPQPTDLSSSPAQPPPSSSSSSPPSSSPTSLINRIGALPPTGPRSLLNGSTQSRTAKPTLNGHTNNPLTGQSRQPPTGPSALQQKPIHKGKQVEIKWSEQAIASSSRNSIPEPGPSSSAARPTPLVAPSLNGKTSSGWSSSFSTIAQPTPRTFHSHRERQPPQPSAEPPPPPPPSITPPPPPPPSDTPPPPPPPPPPSESPPPPPPPPSDHPPPPPPPPPLTKPPPPPSSAPPPPPPPRIKSPRPPPRTTPPPPPSRPPAIPLPPSHPPPPSPSPPPPPPPPTSQPPPPPPTSESRSSPISIHPLPTPPPPSTSRTQRPASSLPPAPIRIPLPARPDTSHHLSVPPSTRVASPVRSPLPPPPPSSKPSSPHAPPPPRSSSPAPVYSLPPLPPWPPARSEYPSARNFKVLFDPAIDKDRDLKFALLMDKVRETGAAETRIKTKGGKETLLRFDGEVVRGESEVVLGDPRRAAGFRKQASLRPFRTELYEVKYEYDENSSGPPPPTSVLVTNVSPLAPKEQIRRHFSAYGPILMFEPQVDKATGGALGIIFIKYGSHAEATRCVEREHGRKLGPAILGLNVGGEEFEIKVVFDGERKRLRAVLHELEERKRLKRTTPMTAHGLPTPPTPWHCSHSHGSSASSHLRAQASASTPPAASSLPPPGHVHGLPPKPVTPSSSQANGGFTGGPLAPMVGRVRRPPPTLVKARRAAASAYHTTPHGGRTSADSTPVPPLRPTSLSRGRRGGRNRVPMAMDHYSPPHSRSWSRSRSRSRSRSPSPALRRPGQSSRNAQARQREAVLEALGRNHYEHVKIDGNGGLLGSAVTEEDVRAFVGQFQVDQVLRDHTGWYVTFKASGIARRAAMVLNMRSLAHHSVTLTVHPPPSSTHAPAAKSSWSDAELVEEASQVIRKELRQLLEKDIVERLVSMRLRRLVADHKRSAAPVKNKVVAAVADGKPGAEVPLFGAGAGLKGLSFKKANKRAREEAKPVPVPDPDAELGAGAEIEEKTVEQRELAAPPKKKRKKEARLVVAEIESDGEQEEPELLPPALTPAVVEERKRALVKDEDEDAPPAKKTKSEVMDEKELVEITEVTPVSAKRSQPPAETKKRTSSKVKARPVKKTGVDTPVDQFVLPDGDFTAPVVAQLHFTDRPSSVSPPQSPVLKPKPRLPTPPPDPYGPGLCEDDEDLYFARLALAESMGIALPEPAPTPVPDPASPPPFRVHLTGSARTEGYYKISHAEKSAYVAQYANRGAAADPAESQPQQPKPAMTSSRSNRANARRQAQGLEEINQVQRAMALSKGETAAAELSIKFNQLQTRKKHLRFARSPIHDWGLYAMERISRGEMVIEYVGEVIRAQVADKREKAYERQGIGSSYLFRIDEDLVVDATKKGNLGRLINHSCDPNCTAKIITINGEKKIVIYAKQDIELGDEITYDYHFPIEQDKIPCLCGSAKCRGYLN